MILLDIDYFKSVNDTYGHLIGDQLLKHVAQICQSTLGKDTLFARFGGEEFVLALEGFSAEEGKEAADQIRREIESQPLAADDLVISVTASFGVAEATKEQEETLTKLLNQRKKMDEIVCMFIHIWLGNTQSYNKLCLTLGRGT